MRHFRYFPQIEYSQHTAVNLLARSKIRDMVLENIALYYQYVVKDGERADIISTKYYGTSKHTWVIYYANEIVDPTEQWPLGALEFEKHLANKYGSMYQAQQQFSHYLLDDKLVIDETTYLDGNIDFNRKRIVTKFDVEFEENERKRNLVVLDKIYLRQMLVELRKLFDTQ